MNIRAVIFDMDGVLIDSEPGYRVAEERMMASMGLPFGTEQITVLTGASYRTLGPTLRGWNPGIKLSDQEIQNMYVGGLLEVLKKGDIGLIDGVEEFMEFLKARDIGMAVGSSSHRDMVDFVVERFNLRRYVSAVVSGTDAPRGKPAPDIFLMCARQMGVEPEECLVIEDSVNGLNAAINANMPCAAFVGTSQHMFDMSGALLTMDAFDTVNFQKIEALLSGERVV